MAKRLGSIFEHITTDTYVTAGELAKRAGVSERTIRSRVKEIDLILQKHGAQIIAKQRHGYRLQVMDEALYDLFLEQIQYKEKGFRPSNTKERVNLLLAYLIVNRGHYTKIEELIDYFYCSSNTISSDIKRAEEIFFQYHILIERRPNYGIKIKGKEFDIRHLNAVCMLQDKHFYFGNEKRKHEELQDISRLLNLALTRYQISVNEIAFDQLVKTFYAQIKNVSHGFDFYQEETGFQRFEDNILECARYLHKELEKRFSIQLSQDELYYIAFHISANRCIDDTHYNFIISDDIMENVHKMLESVNEAFSLDMRKDVDVQLSLAKHYMPFNIRFHYDLQLENPLLNEIKTKYAYAMEISKEALLPIMQESGKMISEDEISYFALIFEYALEKSRQIKQKKNILLVCSSGAGSTKLLLYKLHAEFKEYIDHIIVKSIYTLTEKDFDQIDFVFTTVPINRPVPIPVVEIHTFLGEEQLHELKSVFEASEKSMLDDCFDEKLFFPHVHATTYEQAIQDICDRIKREYFLPEDFYESIMKREQIASTDFGNLVAVPHPYQVMNTQMIAAVAVLDHPIVWCKQKVQVIFLFSLNLQKEEAKIFYKALVAFANNVEAIQKLISTRDFQIFLSELKQEYSQQ